MGWSLNIGRLFGIPIKIHFSLFILLGFLLLASSSAGSGLYGVLIAVLLFGSVTAHELGHALVARRYGVDTKEIVLLPIGGAALLSRNPDEPKQELLIAIAGPVVSLVLSGLAFLAWQAVALTVLADLFFVNLVLGLFNLVPAFPMDGGRVLRAGLANWMGNMRATRVAAKLGRLVAVAFMVIAVVYSEIILGFIGAFIFFAATAEERAAIIQNIVGLRRVTDLMQPTPAILGAGATVADAIAGFASSPGVAALPVAFGTHVLGVVHRGDAEGVPSPDEHMVNELVDRNVVTHDGDAPLMELLTRMGQSRSRAAVVTAANEVVGIVTLDRVLEEIRAARHAEF
ncbi:MAG: site-2 protease family protein [Deltaproteobacteria bacterium]|nr:MAG: site-2 protease family protein [Deltaproteobacteria bacterium]